MLVAFTSCSGTQDYPATSQYILEEGEIPPWLLEGDESMQISAAETTQNRNDIPFPEETAMVSTEENTSSQVQPNMADVPPPPPTSSEVTFIEKPVTPTESTLPTSPKPVATVKPPKQTTSSGRPTQNKKPGKAPKQKFTEPTLITYTVQKGDNLYDIAKRSRTTVAQIKKDSGLKKDVIYPGQKIKVRYIPKGYKPGASTQEASNGKPRVHVVAKGETISGIAKKYGVPYTQILKANNLSLSDAAKIRPGKRLSIPAPASVKKQKRK